jgi:hypothetical protein
MEAIYKWGIKFSDLFFPEYTHDYVIEGTRSKYAEVPVQFKWDELPTGVQKILQGRLKYRFIEDQRQKLWNRMKREEESRVVPIKRTGQFHQTLQNRYRRKSKSDSFRMTSFAGGTYDFPLSAWPEIRRIRDIDLSRDIAVFDNEFSLSESGVRFFVEVDYRIQIKDIFWEEDIPNSQTLREDAVAIFHTLQIKFGGKLTGAVLLTSPPKLKNDLVIAVGSHLIFENLVVNCEFGRELCHYLRIKTQLDIDDAPYKTNYACLRPAFSRKTGDCPNCKVLGEYKYPDCPLCLGNLKVGLGSFYTPVLNLDQSGNPYPYLNEPTYITPDESYQFKQPNLQYVLHDNLPRPPR